MNAPDTFTYWKRPWHKWVILGTAALQLLCLWTNWQDYRNSQTEELLSIPIRAIYAAQQRLSCACSGLLAAVFLGHFLIGCLARSQRTARLAEAVLYPMLTLAWGVAGIVLDLTTNKTTLFFWCLILLAAIFSSFYALHQYRKTS